MTRRGKYGMKAGLFAASVLCLAMLNGCAASKQKTAVPEETYVSEVMELKEEAVPLAGAPLPDNMKPAASGTQVKSSSQASIDYSNTRDGYVMVQFSGSTNKRLKAQVKGPSTTYTYNINQGQWTTFPLSDGNGGYQVTVYENVTDSKYAAVVSADFSVSLSDEFAPFVRPNQYVDYSNAPNTVAKAAELTSGKDTLSAVKVVYDYVVTNISYDTQLAATVQSGYLPVLDNVLAKKSGICFDYAALMAGMLRSQGIPCKLVVGYAGTAYHAWISVWSAETGWVEGVVFFDGSTWQRMDPTFASSGGQSEAIMQYIGDGSNYTTKYLY